MSVLTRSPKGSTESEQAATAEEGTPDEAPLAPTEPVERDRPEAVEPAKPSRWLAILRVLLGFTFLWAFIDKTFGLGYATTHDNAWIHGGSPAGGFLSHVAVGPMQDTFNNWADKGWVDWLFMVAMIGIGLALILGVALRVTALAGVAMMTLMWLAEWPLAKHSSTGQPTGSSNPIVDYHVIYAAVFAALAATRAGDRWGLGRWWKRLPVIRRARSLLE